MVIRRPRSNAVTQDDLGSARQSIADLFRRQCLHGRQSAEFLPTQAACGQYLGRLESSHVGLHGTAAAILVSGSAGDSELYEKLAGHAASRYERAEPATQTSLLPGDDERRRNDRENVIKVSELLYALTFGPLAVQPSEFIASLVQRLRRGQLEERGWSYFLETPSGGPEPLPTAHAVRALARADAVPAGARNYLAQQLEMEPGQGTDVFVQVAALMVLSELAVPDSREQKDLRLRLKRLWRRLDPLLGEDLESNVEYSRGDQNFYVRIPWQIYLLLAARRLAPLRRYSSYSAQRRLASVVAAVKSPNGFYYPHSGQRLSSRTNGILYDAFRVLSELGAVKFWRPFFWHDRLRRVAGSTIVTVLLICGAAIVATYAVISWVSSGEASWAALAPDFVVSLLLILAAVRRSPP
jgi:hypothetical protein